MSELWEKANYRSDIHYLIDNLIHEYDITKANISVLRDAGVLSEEEYQYYYSAPKTQREIAIGKMQGKDPRITFILKEGISNARRIFLESNNIEDSRVIAIRNDAITIIGNPVYNVQITDLVAFRLVGSYSSYYHINDIDLFYLYDIVSGDEKLDIKGMGDESVELHKFHFLEFLAELFYSAQIEGIPSAITLLRFFYDNYVNKRLDVNYYRELNSRSYFSYSKDIDLMYSHIYTDICVESDKKYLNIGYNERILRYLNRIYSSIYFGKNTR